MQYTLQSRLLHRELGYSSPYSSITGLYGDKSWILDLDIINELGGHGGCVNALSWSKSGRLLASGSDDQHLNIHSYQPELSISPFSLTTAVATGHTANIFSVKFMPHSNDGTLITCAGDAEVRVFDIEYSGQSAPPSIPSSRDFSHRYKLYRGIRYLNDGNTNARIYRSHGDRVKRIVTESSPFLFLSCSEDGEVRQWDLRLPSSAYPAPRSGRGSSVYGGRHDSSNAPPPLISYKRYHLDLNTISCSASQPHYIVLGGAHLHCFLHDRRMAGRNLLEEHGSPGTAFPATNLSDHDDDLMAQATQCVRRFVPRGKKKLRRVDNGHVTACKISDFNPNEMIASWSGDHIYCFDLIQTPDVRETGHQNDRNASTGTRVGKLRESKDHKRKRRAADTSTSLEGLQRGDSRPRQRLVDSDGNLALRVRYENGQSEEISINSPNPNITRALAEDVRETILPEPQRRSLQIAKSVAKLRKLLFSSDVSSRIDDNHTSSARFPQTSNFTSILGFAAVCLPEMDDVIRSWTYPVTPLQEDVMFQMTLRRNRDSSRRFVQAAGTIARVLGGRLRTPSHNTALRSFEHVSSSPTEGSSRDMGQIFSYDFLKAILLWLEGGPVALLKGFERASGPRATNIRFPIPEGSVQSALNEYLIPYLLGLARNRPILNVDASRFERDESRLVFETEAAAVVAFSHAIRIPLEDRFQALVPLSSAQASGRSVPLLATQDRSVALRFWGFNVGRGVLMNAGEGVTLAFVDIAFGGQGLPQDVDEGRIQEEIALNAIDEIIHPANLVRGASAEGPEQRQSSADLRQSQRTPLELNEPRSNLEPRSENTIREHSDRRMKDGDDDDDEKEAEEEEEEEEIVLMEDLQSEFSQVIHDHESSSDNEMRSETNGGDNDDGDGSDGGGGGRGDDSDDDVDNDDDDDNGSITTEERRFMWQSASKRGKLRESVGIDVPCSTHTRQYRGHCNIKTVKDVNFFGLQDEYVVSGSDSGHVFVWDKKTSQLLNILEGDGEVVNVVQGHPYEPLLAVSGIDHTIKIFSPDMKSQYDARCGINISNYSTQPIGRSSVFGFRLDTNFPSEISSEAPPADESVEEQPERTLRLENENEGDELSPPKFGGLSSRRRMQDSYQIISQNDVERQGSMRDAFITRGMLAQLAARMRPRHEPGEAGEAAIMLDDNCLVM